MSSPAHAARGTYTFQQTFYMHPPSPDAAHSSSPSHSISQTFTFPRCSSPSSSPVLSQTIYAHPAPSPPSSSSSSPLLPSIQERTERVMRDKAKFKSDISNVVIDMEKVCRYPNYKTSLCRSVYERIKCDRENGVCRFAHSFTEWWAYSMHCRPFKTTPCEAIHDGHNLISNCRFLHDGDLACTVTKRENTFVIDDFYIYPAKPVPSLALSASGSTLPLSIEARIEDAVRDKAQFKRDIGNVAINIEQVMSDPKYKTDLCNSVYERIRCKYGDKCRFAHSLPEWWGYNIRSRPFKAVPCNTTHDTATQQRHCSFLHEGDLGCSSTKRDHIYEINDFFIYRAKSASLGLSSAPTSRKPTPPLTPSHASPHACSSPPISRSSTPSLPPSHASPHACSSPSVSRSSTPSLPPSHASPHACSSPSVSRSSTPSLPPAGASPHACSSPPPEHPASPSQRMYFPGVMSHEDARSHSVVSWLRLEEELLPRRSLPAHPDLHLIDQSLYNWLMHLAQVEL